MSLKQTTKIYLLNMNPCMRDRCVKKKDTHWSWFSVKHDCWPPWPATVFCPYQISQSPTNWIHTQKPTPFTYSCMVNNSIQNCTDSLVVWSIDKCRFCWHTWSHMLGFMLSKSVLTTFVNILFFTFLPLHQFSDHVEKLVGCLCVCFNSRLLSINNHALISTLLTHRVLWVALLISSIDLPLSSSITPSLFHSRFLFCKSFPPQPYFSSSVLTPRISQTVYR